MRSKKGSTAMGPEGSGYAEPKQIGPPLCKNSYKNKYFFLHAFQKWPKSHGPGAQRMCAA